MREREKDKQAIIESDFELLMKPQQLNFYSPRQFRGQSVNWKFRRFSISPFTMEGLTFVESIIFSSFQNCLFDSFAKL
jgi:hypothetical protein